VRLEDEAVTPVSFTSPAVINLAPHPFVSEVRQATPSQPQLITKRSTGRQWIRPNQRTTIHATRRVPCHESRVTDASLRDSPLPRPSASILYRGWHLRISLLQFT
jgi:hypothetical protein